MTRSSASIAASFSVGLLLFAVIAVGAANFRFTDGPRPAPFAGDFVQEYVGGYIVLHGDRSRFYDILYAQQLEHDPDVVGFEWTAGRFPMIYPPFWYLLVAPLYLLPVRVAALVWLALMVAAFIAALHLLAAHYPRRIVLAWAIPMSIFFPPLLESLTSDQKGTLLLLIFTATFILLDRGKPFAAGLVFGLITFKPQFALVIGLAMLVKRQWAFVAGSILTTVVLVGLCFVVGSDVCAQYFRLSLGMAKYIDTSGYPLDRMHCWYGFFPLLLPGSEAAFALALAADVLTLVVLAYLLWAPLPYGRPAFALQFSGLVLATILLSPHLLTYDLSPLMLPVIVLILQATEPGSPLESQQRVVLWLVAIAYGGASVSAMLVPRIHVQVSVLAMFTLLVGLAWVARKTGHSTEGSVPQQSAAM